MAALTARRLPRVMRAQVKPSARAALRALEASRACFTPADATRKGEWLRVLDRASLPRPADVSRLHEVLCFLRAYPDDPRLLRQVVSMLARFDRRADLRRHRAALADTGIAGTDIHYRFFAPTARWLAHRWPGSLAMDWPEFEDAERLERLLPLLVHYAETPALDELDDSLRAWVRRMKRPDETDGAFLARAFERMAADAEVRESLWDELDPPMILAAGPRTPSRSRAWHRVHHIAWQRRPLAGGRTDLAAEVARPPRAVRALSVREGRRLVDLARAAMVTRARDLDAFSNADPHDVRLVDCGDGLQFACMGVVPERRLLLESVYGYLTLKNGVPIGYVLTSALFGSAEVAYNVFETYRGAEAARVYGRVTAMVNRLFRTDAFTIVPYQLGEGNDEALASGAWWFYHKVGFRPRDRATVGLMRRELARMKRRPSHRSSRTTLARLARANVFWSAGRERDDVIGELPLANVGLHVMRYLASRFGSSRALAARVCAREAARLLGVRSTRRWAPGERLAWTRWAPLVLILPGVARWPAAERHALAAVVRAKGGRREQDFVLRFDRHRRLRRALRALAERKAE